MLLDARDWAIAEFQGTPGLEVRLQRRLVHTAARLADQPTGKSLPQRFAWDELKAVYRLVDRCAHQPEQVQQVHRERTRQRMAKTPTVLVIHDPTTLSYSDHAAVADQLGPITDSDTARGLIQHNSLAVDPDGDELLGLIHQQTFCREPKPEGETRSQRYRRTDRESETWITAVKAVGVMPREANWIHVGDRAADFFGLMATCRATQSHFVIRLAQDRVVSVPQENEGESCDADTRQHLMEQARRVSATATKAVEIASRGGRPARMATLSLGAVRVTIRPPQGEPRWRNEAPLTITVVRVWEAHPPADAEPLEWILGTDFSDVSPESLLQYCAWYEWRWPTMEEYHKVQKTGLGIERMRFETKDRLLAAIALLSVVAVRVLGLRWVRDAKPDEPATTLASEVEVAVLEKLEPGVRVRTVREFVDAVGRLGGWLGRTGDGPPGWASIWRGYQRLADLVQGVELAETIKPRKRRTSTTCG